MGRDAIPTSGSAPLRRGTPLIGRPADVIDSLLTHPQQIKNVARVAQLIYALRACREPEDYFEFQSDLFKAVYDSQEHGRAITQAKKRQRAGKAFDTDLLGSSGDLETEQILNDRVVRQLRSVGDALAWRLFGFDRRYIIALSQNQPVGPMSGKEGLDYELGLVVELWREKRHFALLHDLTACLRIGDLTEFYSDGSHIMIHEVKANPRRRDPAQTRRAMAAVATIQHGAPLQGWEGDAALVRSAYHLKTLLPAARNVLEEAANKGLAARRLPGPRVLTVLDGTSRRLPESASAVADLDALRRRALEEAGNHGAHRLRAHTGDTASRVPAMAPLGVFPYKPTVCARLICDYMVMEWFLNDVAFRDALEAAGLRVRIMLPRADGEVDHSEAVLQASLEHKAVTLHGGAVHQVLLEALDLETYAAAIREMLESETGMPSAVLVFSEERRLWR
jgi:hypothetical protein